MAYLYCYKCAQEKSPDSFRVHFQLYNNADKEIDSCVVKKEDIIPLDIGGLVKLISISRQDIHSDSTRIGIREINQRISYFFVPRDNIQENISVIKY